MATKAVAIDELPSIAPIRTQASEESSTEECSTPTSEDQKLKPVLTCPPAPRKPRPLKRKLSTTTRPIDLYFVPRDLSAVFRLLPPKKRIRVSG